MSKLSLKAKNFAERAHKDQVRKYSGELYSVHLREVAGLCAEVGCRDEVVAAAWLHDIVEDQGISFRFLTEVFGLDVSQLVEELTDISKPSDGNRDVRKRLDREHSAKASPEGQTIKLADLISNSRDIVARDPHFAVTYMREKELLLPLLKEGNQVLWQRAKDILDQYKRTK
jgi:(p)ppGpp synthase/HD superfamily hydrolase